LDTKRNPIDTSVFNDQLSSAANLLSEFSTPESWESFWIQIAQTSWKLFPSAYSWLLRIEEGGGFSLGDLRTPQSTKNRYPFGFQRLPTTDAHEIQQSLNILSGTFFLDANEAPRWLVGLTRGSSVDAWIFCLLGDPKKPLGWIVYKSSVAWYLAKSNLPKAKILSEGLQKIISVVESQSKQEEKSKDTPVRVVALDPDQAIEHLEGFLRSPTPERELWGYGVLGCILGPIPEDNHPTFPIVMRAHETAAHRLETWTSGRQGIFLLLPGQRFVLGFQGIRPFDFLPALDDLHQLLITQTRDLGYPIGIGYQVWDSRGNVRLLWKERVSFLTDKLS